jgi:hypothetical protein
MEVSGLLHASVSLAPTPSGYEAGRARGLDAVAKRKIPSPAWNEIPVGQTLILEALVSHPRRGFLQSLQAIIWI